jgi:hypothetical protein
MKCDGCEKETDDLITCEYCGAYLCDDCLTQRCPKNPYNILVEVEIINNAPTSQGS